MAALAGLSLLTGCVGARDRDELRAMIQARGGGASNRAIDEVLDTLTSEVGGEPAIRQATFGFGETYVGAQVTVESNPLTVDDVTVYGTKVRYRAPVRNPEETATVPAGRIAELDVEAMVDRSLAEFGVADAYASNMIVTPSTDRIQITVESPRASGYSVFDLAGAFQEFVRS